jgi:small subunit ribosomal protein S24e
VKFESAVSGYQSKSNDVNLIRRNLKVEGVMMKIEISEKVENPLLQRTEIKFKVDHSSGPTPKRLEVRAQLAGQLGVPEEVVIIDKVASMYGRQAASGIARVYSSRQGLEELEPKYLLQRGLPKEAKEKEKPVEKPKAEEKPKEPKEKPKEKEKAEKPKEEKVKEEKPKEKEERLKEGKPKEEKPGKSEGK